MRDYVRQVWEERSEALGRHVSDKLAGLKQVRGAETMSHTGVPCAGPGVLRKA